MLISYRISQDEVCLLKEADKIDFQTPFMEKKVGKELEINVAQELGINPKNIFRYLKKLVGEKVEVEDTLAEKKGFFSTTKSLSPQAGIIKEIDHHRGIIIISSETNDKNKIFSPFKGEVEKINKDSLQIKVGKGEEFQVKNSSGDFGGEVLYLEPESSFNSEDLINKIVVTSKINSYFQIKTEALGVKGYITIEKLPEKTDIYSAAIKNLEDFKKIKKLAFPYCTVVSQSAKIYFYQ